MANLFEGKVVKIWETKSAERGSKGKKQGVVYNARALHELSGAKLTLRSDEEIKLRLDDEVVLKVEKAQKGIAD